MGPDRATPPRPIPQDRLDHRQRRHRRRVGPEHPWPSAIAVVAFRASSIRRSSSAKPPSARSAPPKARAGSRRAPRQDRRAGHPRRRRSDAGRPPSPPARSPKARAARRGQAQHAALLGASTTLAARRSSLSRCTWVRRVNHRHEARGAHLHRLLRHVVEAGVFQRREQQPEVTGRVWSRTFSTSVSATPRLPARDTAARNSPEAPSKTWIGSPSFQAQHSEQVVRLLGACPRSARPARAGPGTSSRGRVKS